MGGGGGAAGGRGGGRGAVAGDAIGASPVRSGVSRLARRGAREYRQDDIDVARGRGWTHRRTSPRSTPRRWRSQRTRRGRGGSGVATSRRSSVLSCRAPVALPNDVRQPSPGRERASALGRAPATRQLKFDARRALTKPRPSRAFSLFARAGRRLAAQHPRARTLRRPPRTVAMEVADIAVKPVRDFAKDSIRLVKRCTKPDRKEFSKVALRTGMGFIVMGFVGFFVKLILCVFPSIPPNPSGGIERPIRRAPTARDRPRTPRSRRDPTLSPRIFRAIVREINVRPRPVPRAGPRPAASSAARRAREDRHRAIPSRDSTRHPETTARVDAPSPFLGSLGAIVEARIRDSRLARDTFSTHATQSPTHPSLSSARLRPLADPATRPPPQHPNQQHHPRRVSSAPRRARDDRPS